MYMDNNVTYGNVFEELESSQACNTAIAQDDIKIHTLKLIEECSELIIEACELLQSKGKMRFEEFISLNARSSRDFARRALIYPNITAREPETTDNLASEMADVLICCACVKNIYIPSEDLDSSIRYKLNRMQERFDERKKQRLLENAGVINGYQRSAINQS